MAGSKLGSKGGWTYRAKIVFVTACGQEAVVVEGKRLKLQPARQRAMDA